MNGHKQSPGENDKIHYHPGSYRRVKCIRIITRHAASRLEGFDTNLGVLGRSALKGMERERRKGGCKCEKGGGKARSRGERAGGAANRVVEALTRLCIEVVELLILITQLSRAENGPAAFAVSSRPALRNKLTATPSLATTTGTNITTTTRRSPPTPPHPFTTLRHYHYRQPLPLPPPPPPPPPSPSSIRSITWVLIKRNTSSPPRFNHPFRPWEVVSARGCSAINIIYRRLNRPATSNRHLETPWILCPVRSKSQTAASEKTDAKPKTLEWFPTFEALDKDKKIVSGSVFLCRVYPWSFYYCYFSTQSFELSWVENMKSNKEDKIKYNALITISD